MTPVAEREEGNSEMIRPVLLLSMAAILSGCASMTYPLPKCDGYSRRPLNRAMWEWEDNSKVKQEHSDAQPVTSVSIATAFVEERKGLPAFAHLNIAASYHPCEG